MANDPTTQPIITSMEGAVLSVKLDSLKEQIGEIVKAMGEMQRTMQTLLQVEREQRDFRGALDRSFAEIRAERDKIVVIERELIGLRSMRRWVIGLTTSAAAMLGVALMTLLIINPLYRGYGQLTPTQIITVPEHPK
jgi:hypothetical protein